MKWSLLIGKFFGTDIRLHASLLLLIPYALIAFRPSDLIGALRVLFLIAAIFLCVTLHEIGHTIAARLYGIEVSSIVLWPLGGFANLSRRPEKVLPDLIISAAGPLTNLLIFIFLGLITAALRILEVSMAFPRVSRLLWSMEAFPFLFGLTIANLSLAVFNLVPVYPLDGGQIARGLLKLIFGEKRADIILMVFSLPLALALVIAGLVMKDVAIILTGALLLLGGATLNTRLLNNILLGWLYFIDRGGFHLKRSDFDPALRDYTRAIQRSPNRAGLYISRAVVYMNLMELDKAATDIEHALTIDKNSHLAWALRGELYALQKNQAIAMDCYNQAITLRPNWHSGYMDRGGLYQEMGDFNRALEDLNKSVEIGRGSPVAYLMRSILLFQMGSREAAGKDAEQALRYAPHWMLVFPEVFLINLTGHLDWALDYYQQAIELLPNAYQSFQGRADVCRINGRPGWALEDYQRAILLAPRQAELYLNRGQVYLALGSLDKAAEDFHQAVQLADRSHIRRTAQSLLDQLSTQRLLAAAQPASSTAIDVPVDTPVPGEPAAPPEESA